MGNKKDKKVAKPAKKPRKVSNARSGKPLALRKFEDEQKAKRAEIKEKNKKITQAKASKKLESSDEDFLGLVDEINSSVEKATLKKESNKDKAYKLLAEQEGISNSEAKSLIDRGLVYVANKKVMIARGDLDKKSRFVVQKVEKIRTIFENDNLIVVDKPAFLNSDEIEKQYKGAQLLHRLDRETSGVLILVKDEEFREKAIKAFKNDEVYKEYVAIVEGVFIENLEINKPILTEKVKNKAYSKISKAGKDARSEVFPVTVSGKLSKVKVIIHEGRTHQIRVHLSSSGFPILGDELYGGRRYKRVMLHAKKVELLGMSFESREPTEFTHLSES
jgi:23S rRNA pseudouridine1911/1915/1917 synthase